MGRRSVRWVGSALTLVAMSACSLALAGCHVVSGLSDFEAVGGDTPSGGGHGGQLGTGGAGGAIGTAGAGAIGAGGAGGTASGTGGDAGGPLTNTCDPMQSGQFEHPVTGHCYWYFTDDRNWDDARSECLGLDADLAAINSDAERFFVDDVVDLGGEVWIGGSDRAAEGTFTWSNGEPWAANSGWGPGQPDNNNSAQDCVLVDTVSGMSNDVFDDQECDNVRGFLCERSPQ